MLGYYTEIYIRRCKTDCVSVLTDITKVTKIIGCYNDSRHYLFVNKVIGNINFCLGLIKIGNTYVPSSALLANIKRFVENHRRCWQLHCKNTYDF